jgi:hypothetical protein
VPPHAYNQIVVVVDGLRGTLPRPRAEPNLHVDRRRWRIEGARRGHLNQSRRIGRIVSPHGCFTPPVPDGGNQGGPCQQAGECHQPSRARGGPLPPGCDRQAPILPPVTVCCDRALHALRVSVASPMVVLRGKSTSCHVKRSLRDSRRRGLPLAYSEVRLM